MQYVVGWQTVPWDGKGPQGETAPTCAVCGVMLHPDGVFPYEPGVMWERVATGELTARCDRHVPEALAPRKMWEGESLSSLALGRASQLVDWAISACGAERWVSAAGNAYRAGLMLDAARATLRAEHQVPLANEGDLYQVLWVQPWSEAADEVAVAEYLATYYETPRSAGLDLADYLFLNHRHEPLTLAYWVSRVLSADRALASERGDAQVVLPMGVDRG